MNEFEPMDEKQLIEGCKKGDRKAQKALYDIFSRRMMGVCLRYMKDTENARDLLQDGFVKLFTSISSYSGIGSFEGWVRRIFINCALERLRLHYGRDVITMVDDYDFSEMIDESSVSQLSVDDLMMYINILPDGYRTVFNMFAVEGYSHKEIGEMLNITESTSRSQYMRARNMLQKMILKS